MTAVTGPPWDRLERTHHEEEALRGCEGSGERPGHQSAVQSAGRTALRLHLHHRHLLAKHIHLRVRAHLTQRMSMAAVSSAKTRATTLAKCQADRAL